MEDDRGLQKANTPPYLASRYLVGNRNWYRRGMGSTLESRRVHPLWMIVFAGRYDSPIVATNTMLYWTKDSPPTASTGRSP